MHTQVTSGQSLVLNWMFALLITTKDLGLEEIKLSKCVHSDLPHSWLNHFVLPVI